MIRKVKAYAAEVKTTLGTIADHFETLTQRTVELTTAVTALAAKLESMTASLKYLETDRRSHNQRAGHIVQ